jgi:NTP pyrophosphatase (non-canonical NTP hydrolase)
VTLPMEVPLETLAPKQREKLAADERMEACREWRRSEDVSIRPEVAEFAIDMELKLMRNDAKGDWRGMDVGQLLDLLEAELDELADAVMNGTDDDVIDEAADVANFAMMIADVCRKRTEVRNVKP